MIRRNLFPALLFLALAGNAHATSPDPVANRINGLLDASGVASRDVGYITKRLLAEQAADYQIYFDEGAAKGWAMVQADGTAFSGTALEVNLGYAGPYRLGVVLGITGTIIPATEATGLDITADASAANNDAVELFGGMLGASGRPFIVGTDPAFGFCAGLKIHDVSGSDNLLVGFRTVTIPAAAHTSYTDFAAIGNVSGTIKITTDLANAGETVTSTTDSWADDATKTLCVNVSGAGVTTYTVNGAAPTATAAFTFGDGASVIPFIYVLQDSDLSDDTHLISWVVKSL
jgi:hypothetical protein